MVRIALVVLVAFAVQDPTPPTVSDKAKELLKELDTLRGMAGEVAAFQKQLEGMKDKYAAAMKANDQKTMDELKEEFAKVQAKFQEMRAKIPPAAQALDKKLDAEVKAAADDISLLGVRAQLKELLGKPADARADAEAFLAKAKGPVDWILAVADVARRAKSLDVARKAVAPLVKDHPSAAAIEGLIAFETNELEVAAKALDEALKVKDKLTQDQRTEVERAAPEAAIRLKESKANDNPLVVISTTRGDIEAELFENQAPNTVANFIELAERKFFDGLKFHRVIPNFMIQGGDPAGNGSGGPGYNFADEVGNGYRKHFRGSLSMANAGPNTNGSQFFVTHLATIWLDGKHTVFGRVLKGLEVVDAVQQGDVIKSVTVTRKRDHEYKVTKLGK